MCITWRVVTIGFAGDRTESHAGLSWERANVIRDQIVANGGRAAVEAEDDGTVVVPQSALQCIPCEKPATQKTAL